MRTLFERNHQVERIEIQSQTIMSQMAKLAECIYLLARGSSWSERRMQSLLMNNQTVHLKYGDSESGDSWKSYNWVATFWPEMESDSSMESTSDDP